MAPRPLTLGLNERQLAALTGFTSRFAVAIAGLREAWLVADSENATAIEQCLRELLASSHSAQRNRELLATVLVHGLDPEQGRELLTRSGWA